MSYLDIVEFHPLDAANTSIRNSVPRTFIVAYRFKRQRDVVAAKDVNAQGVVCVRLSPYVRAVGVPCRVGRQQVDAIVCNQRGTLQETGVLSSQNGGIRGGGAVYKVACDIKDASRET